MQCRLLWAWKLATWQKAEWCQQGGHSSCKKLDDHWQSLMTEDWIKWVILGQRLYFGPLLLSQYRDKSYVSTRDQRITCITMAVRPNRLPTSLRDRDRTLISTSTSDSSTRNNSTSSTAPSVQVSGIASGAYTSGGGVNTVNSGSSSEGDPKSDYDKNSAKQTNPHIVTSPNGSTLAGSGSVTQSPNTNSSSRKSPSPLTSNSNSRKSSSPCPSPTPSPGLGIRGSNSRTSSPKLIVKEVVTDEDQSRSDVQNWVRDGMNNLSNVTSQNHQNRLTPPGSGTGFTRVSSLPNTLTTLSDSRESLPSSSKSAGSMDGKEDKEG